MHKFQRSRTYTSGTFKKQLEISRSDEKKNNTCNRKKVITKKNDDVIILDGMFTVYQPELYAIKYNQYFVLKRRNNQKENNDIHLYWYEASSSILPKEQFSVQQLDIQEDSREIFVKTKKGDYQLELNHKKIDKQDDENNFDKWKEVITREKEKSFIAIDLDEITDDPHYKDYKNIFSRKKSVDRIEKDMKELKISTQDHFERLFQQINNIMIHMKKVEQDWIRNKNNVDIQQKTTCHKCLIF